MASPVNNPAYIQQAPRAYCPNIYAVPKGEDGALRWKTLKDMAQEGEAEAAKSKNSNSILTIFSG